MNVKEDWFNDTLLKVLKESNVDIEDIENIENMQKVVENVITCSLPRTSKVLLDSLMINSAEMLEEHRLNRVEFEARLLRRWSKPLNLLEMLIVMSIEVGEKFIKDYRHKAIKRSDFVFDVLIRTHSRACQISYEILCLLRGGFADGAFARWRTLHELSVLSNFIVQSGNDVACKYMEYEHIENYYEMREYQKKCNHINHEPFSAKEIDIITKRRDDLILKYGKEFEKPYGWAMDILPKDKRNLKNIEEITSLDHLRPYYKLSCDNIHSGPKGNNFSLGLLNSYNRSDLLPCGASNYGLADPGQNTTISLNQITACFLTVNPTYERLMIISSMLKLSGEINNLFVDTQLEIESEELSKKTNNTDF